MLLMGMCLKGNTLPRLVYVGEVTVEGTTHGSGLLYRLLQDYPAGKLLIVEGWPSLSHPARRLPGVAYRQFALWPKRGRSRLRRLVSTWLTLTASANAPKLRRCLSGFDPEAVLTVPSGWTWLVAAQLSEDAGLPLHLIIHDDWLPWLPVYPALKPWLDLQFGRLYRRAASRLCVSPFMEEEYRRNYGVAGEVLYPSWAKDWPSFDGLPQSYSKNAGPLVGAYAGRIPFAGYPRLIANLAKCLEAQGGSLLLYGPHSPDVLRSWGLDQRNVLPQGVVDSGELISRLRQEADFVFVPMAFDADEMKYNMQISFPSKLVDYTATGLPLLVCGPVYCSAVRWARRQGEIAEVVTSEKVEELAAAVQRLEQAPYRKRLGLASWEVGNRLFSYRASVETLLRALAVKEGDGVNP